jgi:hypothetical protein
MIPRPDGHVSLLVHFRPREVRDAARALSFLLGGSEPVAMTLDPARGNLELAHVRGIDLPLLTDWLHRRGARVFVRYQHEGWSMPTGAPVSAPAAPLN